MVAAGNHTVEIIALFAKNAASTGYYFYFDYLWPLEPQDVPDAPQIYTDVSFAMDFDTDHGYQKPPAWHLWQLQKLGFEGHADVYMGVFWNNKRRRKRYLQAHHSLVANCSRNSSNGPQHSSRNSTSSPWFRSGSGDIGPKNVSFS